LTTGGAHHNAPNYYDQSTCPETILLLGKAALFAQKQEIFARNQAKQRLIGIVSRFEAKAKYFLKRGITAVIKRKTLVAHL
jgi:hypothetical protein